MKQRHVFLMACLALLVVQVAGCSDGYDPRMPVSGVVILDGKPVPDAKVTFMPKDSRRVANTLTDANGRFDSATTFSSGDGALIGEHFVAITPKNPPPMPGDEISSPGSPGPGAVEKYTAPIPARYGRPKESGLDVTVSHDSSNEYRFELKSK